MKKRLLTVLVTGTVLSLGALAPSVNAQDFDSQIETVNSSIANINEKKSAVNSTIDTLAKELSDVQTKIDATQAKKAEVQEQIETLKAEIAKLEKVIAERNTRLEEQARSVQTNGARSYLDFLLNAESLSDAVSRIGVVMDLMSANRELMQQQAEDKKQVESKEEAQQEKLAEQEAAEKDLKERAPIVTIMGHVDHGKTTLLDTIRNSRVTAGEAGGITQHIGAYQVRAKDKKITFLDTPGHAAFTTMRARGAKITDVTILVVAADDGVMPQTIEAINHAKAADVPIIVAVNKMDKPQANPDRVMNELVEYGLISEEWGGDTIFVPISALKGEGIDELLENILLVTEMQELKANPNRLALGTVIEAKLDKGRGAVATLLVQNGSLNVGDPLVVGNTFGRVRAMINDRSKNIQTAKPSTPVEITGLQDVPNAGDRFVVFGDEKTARQIGEKRQQQYIETTRQANSAVSLDTLFEQMKQGEMKDLNIIIKADVQGSVEALAMSLAKIDVEGVNVRIIHTGVGAINESDITLAVASNAVVIGFNVRPDNNAKQMAQTEQVDIRLHSIIYKVIEEIEAAMTGLLDPEFVEKVIGLAEVRQVYKVSKIGTIAGAYVTEGKVSRDGKVRVIRDSVVIYEGEIDTLRRFKDDVKDNGDGTHTVTIKDGNGNTTTTIVKDGATGAKGEAGNTGADGKNAKADVKDNGDGTHTVTIVDGDGKTTTTIVKDGKNAEAEVKDNGDGTHTVTIKDGNGNTTTTVVKDGAKGDTGATGAKGDTGENGKSAEGKVERDEAKGTSTITINNFDKDGKVISTTTATVKDGKDGKDGKDADGTFGLVDETGTTDGSISKKLNNTIQIKGDAGTKVQVFDKATGKTSEKEVQNIFVKKDGDALKVSLNPDLTVNSVTTNELKAGPVTINQGGIDAGNTTIKNVAPGKNGTDAVNVDQLNQKFGDVNSNVNKVDNNARAGVAQALATAGLPQAYLPGKSMLAIGGGHYRGETGYAVGFSSISDGGNWIIKGTASGNSRGHFGATAAVGYQW